MAIILKVHHLHIGELFHFNFIVYLGIHGFIVSTIHVSEGRQLLFVPSLPTNVVARRYMNDFINASVEVNQGAIVLEFLSELI